MAAAAPRRGAFKRYELVERIGIGGMAEVYRANGIMQDDSIVPIVIKKILPNLSGDPSFQQMFVDEARITSHLDHPNLVRLVDLGRMDDQLFLALELVDGVDLQRVLANLESQRLRMPFGDSAYVICKVLEALEYAHTRTMADGTSLGIVHRDVSPGNVLLSRDGAVKLTDFGIAKGAVRGGQTMVGAVKGNLRYIAPEQITGGVVGAWSDTYACGMVLFRMIVGRYPVEFDALGTLVGMVVEGHIPKPRDLDPQIPMELDAIITKAISLEPAARYGTARSFREALERWAREARMVLAHQGVSGVVRTQMALDSKAAQKTVVGKPSLPSQSISVAEKAPNRPGENDDVSVYRSQSNPIPTRANPFLPEVEVVDADVAEVTRKSIVRKPRPTKEITEDHTTTDEVRPSFSRNIDDSKDLPVVKGSAMGTSDFVVPDDLPVLKSGEWPAAQEARRGSTSIEPRRPTPSPFEENLEIAEKTAPSGVQKEDSKSTSRGVPNLAAGVAEPEGRRGWEPDLDALGEPATAASPVPPAPPAKVSAPPGPATKVSPPPAAASRPPSGPLASTTDSFAIPVLAAPPPPMAAPPPPVEEEESTRTTSTTTPQSAGVEETGTTRKSTQTPPPHAQPPAPPVGAVRPAAATMAIGGFMGHRETVSSIAIAPSSRFVATGSHDQSVRIWDPATRREVRNLQGHTAAVTAVAISPDGKLIASGSRDKLVRVWDPIAGKELFALTGHTDWVFSVAWSHDARLIVSAGADRTVRVWDVAKQAELFVCTGHGGIVTQARFLPSWTKQIVSAGYDMSLRIWSLANGAEVRKLGTPSMESVRALAVSPEGAYAFSGGADCVVRVWDIATGSVDAMHGHSGPVVTLASPDGNIVGSGSHDGSVKIWDVGARREMKTLRGHRGSVMALAFSPDGKYLLTGGDDRIVAIWQLGA